MAVTTTAADAVLCTWFSEVFGKCWDRYIGVVGNYVAI